MTNIINLFEARRVKETSNKESFEPADEQFRGMQLSLPFFASDPLFLVDVQNFIAQDDFYNFCAAINPGAIVDLRLVPRLDFIRPTRKQAFELFDVFRFDYCDVFGRLSISNYNLGDTEMKNIISAIDFQSAKINGTGPMIALVDNLIFCQQIGLRLKSVFEVSSLDRDSVKRLVIEGARQQM